MSAGWDPSAAPSPSPQQYAQAAVDYARRRTGAAGVMLIIVGVINLIPTFFNANGAAQQFQMTDDEFVTQMKVAFEPLEKLAPGFHKAMVEAIEQPGARAQAATSGAVMAGLSGLTSLLMIFGGMWMRDLTGYGVAMSGAILGAIPCVTTTGCCLLGQIAGIWVIVVLLDPMVRTAFALVSGRPGQPSPHDPRQGGFPR